MKSEESDKKDDHETTYIESFAKKFDFPSIWISEIFLNPKHSDLLYTITSSEIHPETVFKPAVLEGEKFYDKHFEALKEINPDLVHGDHTDNLVYFKLNELEEDPWDIVVNESI